MLRWKVIIYLKLEFYPQKGMKLYRIMLNKKYIKWNLVGINILIKNVKIVALLEFINLCGQLHILKMQLNRLCQM